MENITTPILNEFKRRISHPFLSSFALALLSANYKFFLVISSDDSYRGKISCIENILYPGIVDFAIHFFILPVAVACFFAFAWPLIDAEISVISVKLENKKALKILLEQRKEPVDKDEQAEYFNRQDKHIAELKGRLASTHGRESKLLKERAQQIDQLTVRLREQAIQRLADIGQVSSSDIRSIYAYEDWVLTQHNERLTEAAKRIPHIKTIGKIGEAIEKVPLTDEYRKVGNLE